MDTSDYDPGPFLEWVRPQMQRREWNGSDLARRMGLPISSVARWLRGERQPSPESCDLIADVFGAEVDTVLSLVGHRPTLEPIDPNDQRARIISLVRRVDISDPARGDGLEAMLRTWIDVDRKARLSQPSGASS